MDLESKKTAARDFLRNAAKNTKQDSTTDLASRANSWKERFQRAIADNFDRPYQMVESRELVGLFSCIFVRQDYMSALAHLTSYTISTGLGGTYGNKGAIAIRFVLFDSSFCFVTTHLPAHQDKVGKRNVDAITIIRSSGFAPVLDHGSVFFVRGGDGSHILDHEFCFFFGDLNYRIDLERDLVERLIEQNDWVTLWQHDQLLRQKSTASPLQIFDECELNFAPTYKYDVGTDDFDSSEKRRVPAWCDRILFRDGAARNLISAIDSQHRATIEAKQKLVPLDYRRYECKLSDHRPIGGCFRVFAKSVLPDQFQATRKQIDILAEARNKATLWTAMILWIASRLNADDNFSPSIRERLDAILRQASFDIDFAMNISSTNFAQ